MDGRQIADFDRTYARVLALRAICKEEPTLPGQREARMANPAWKIMSQQCTHLRGLARGMGAANFADQLSKELVANGRLMRKLEQIVEAEPVSLAQRGTYGPNPLSDALAGLQTHARGLTKLLASAKVEVAVDDEDFADLAVLD